MTPDIELRVEREKEKEKSGKIIYEMAGFLMVKIPCLCFQVLGCLLEAGYDVLLSDSDALWLKDPMEDMKLHGFDR